MASVTLAFRLPAPVLARSRWDGARLCAPRPRFGRPRPALAVRMDAAEKETREEVRKDDMRVVRASSERDIEAAYGVWNLCAEDEGMGSFVPDDRDREQSTVVLLARCKKEGVVGAARYLRRGQNVLLERVCVLPGRRGEGIGRMLVEKMIVMASPVDGAVYVNAKRGEMGFFSILGFETQGNDIFEDGTLARVMVYRFPVCVPASGCVGLHHTSIRVSDIERSLAFYGSLGFVVTEKFLTSGASRACFVEGLGTRLEFVESPDGRGGLSGVQGIPPAGFDRLVFDVTKACTDLDGYLEHLQKRNGGFLTIIAAPAQQVIGSCVVSVATIEDPDNLPIEFIRREAHVPSELRTRVDW